MGAYRIGPLRDPRWPEFLRWHPQASIFHTPGWLEALQRTYGYEPVVYTTSVPGQRLTDGIAFCRVRSWLTGVRMVSLPFSDHCQPLAGSADSLEALFAAVETDLGQENWKYVELRPLATPDSEFEARTKFLKSQAFCFHKIDLQPDLDVVFRRFHKNCVQRKIRRAEREGLKHEQGHSPSLLEKFYHLLVATRRRHQLPPQPMLWFRNLIDIFNKKLVIHVASKDGRPIASIVTLSFRNTLVYKYGCSDETFHNLGGMPFLLWKSVQEGKRIGAAEFDLGRSECENSGLIAFKDHFGAARSYLNYYRYSPTQSTNSKKDWKSRFLGHSFALLPDPILAAAGKLLYKHLG